MKVYLKTITQWLRIISFDRMIHPRIVDLIDVDKCGLDCKTRFAIVCQIFLGSLYGWDRLQGCV